MKPRSLRCPCLAVDVLASLPWSDRMQAYRDFEQAISNWQIARLDRRSGGWQWRLDLKRAMRFWSRYKFAVRTAQQGRLAA